MTENITFRYPVSHHIMENYMEVMAYAEDPETKELLQTTLEKARKEVIDAKEEVPEIQEYLTDETDTNLIDLLMVKACENCVYDRYASPKGELVEYVTLDNLLLFQSGIIVTLIGMVFHYCDPAFPSKLNVTLDDRWIGEDCTPELMLPIFFAMEIVKEQGLLPGLESIDWPDDLLDAWEEVCRKIEEE